uniref:Receptor ligand binding region domain-containing protein n=1 Tax=Caenorhabditis japonica TaxID=281687 RepID=A0A8R1IBI0_CAEJA
MFMHQIVLLLFLDLFLLLPTTFSDRVTFFGRYACNVDFSTDYCVSDTYVAQAFYYGLEDGGGMTKNGTFVDSDIKIDFFDPTVQGSFSRGDQTNNYMSSMLDIMLDEHPDDQILAVVGFENDCKQVAALAQAYNAASFGKYRAFAKLAKSIGWTNLAVINFEEDGPTDYTFHDQLLDALSAESITLDYVKKGGFSANLNNAMFTGLESVIDVVMDTYLKTRIYVVVLAYPISGTFFMNVLSSMGLLETGKYFVIMMGPVNSDYNSYYTFNTNRDFSDEWVKFQTRVNNDATKTFCPPLCETESENIAQNDPWSDDDVYRYSESPAIVDAYDMGRLLSETIKVHGASLLRDSKELVKTMSGRGVTSLLGFISKFPNNYVSQREYILWAPQQVSSLYGPIPLTSWANIAAEIIPDGTGNYSVSWNNLTELGIFNGQLPKSKPECGFNDELCLPIIRNLSELEIIVLVVCVVAIIILIGVIAYIARWIAYERRLESSYFLVYRKDVQLVDMTKFGSSRGGSMLQSAISMRSMYEDAGPVEGVNLNFYNNGVRKAARRNQMRKPEKSPIANRDEWVEIIDWHLAKYENTLVTVRKINKPQLKLTREMKQEIDLVCIHDISYVV